MTQDKPIPPLEERIDFRQRWLAGILAWLIPGAGHLYQRRYFKGVVYMVCILGIFVWGSSMGEAKAVHLRWDGADRDAKTRHRSLGYIAQVGVGLPALPAVFQKKRWESQEDAFELQRPAGEVIEEFNAPFKGILRDAEGGDAAVTGTVTGVLQADQFAGEEFAGIFKGQTSTGKPIEVELAGMRRYESSEDLHIGKRICALDDVTITHGGVTDGRTFSADRRRLFARISGGGVGFVEGTIPRPMANHFQVPLEDAALQHIHGRLGKFYELALVYTWIAGLLNVLAVWDCIQGPAYGYGDEPEPEPEPAGESTKPKTVKATASATEAPAPAEAASTSDAVTQAEKG